MTVALLKYDMFNGGDAAERMFPVVRIEGAFVSTDFTGMVGEVACTVTAGADFLLTIQLLPITAPTASDAAHLSNVTNTIDRMLQLSAALIAHSSDDDIVVITLVASSF